MRRSQRLIAATVAVALCSVLAGCGGGGMSSFDPSDMLDFLDTKKKLPGERKPVFPEGVPGLEQGVPKNLYKGAGQDQLDQTAAAPASPPPEEPKSKQKSKSRSKGKQAPASAASADPDSDVAPSEEGAPAALPPEPKQKKQIVRRRTTAPPPDQPAQSSAQQPTTTAQPAQQSAFPAPLPSTR